MFSLNGMSVPQYLGEWQHALKSVLMLGLLVLLAFEPIIFCFDDIEAEPYSDRCPGADRVWRAYSLDSMLSVLIYFIIPTVLAVFRTDVSVYVLACTQLESEVKRLARMDATSAVIQVSGTFGCLSHAILRRSNGVVGGSMTCSRYRRPPISLLSCTAMNV